VDLHSENKPFNTNGVKDATLSQRVAIRREVLANLGKKITGWQREGEIVTR